MLPKCFCTCALVRVLVEHKIQKRDLLTSVKMASITIENFSIQQSKTGWMKYFVDAVAVEVLETLFQRGVD